MEPGRLVAHPDISLVLRGADEATIAPFRALPGGDRRARARVWRPDGTYRATPLRRQPRRLQARTGRSWSSSRCPKLSGRSMRRLWRTGGLLLAGAAFAGLLALSLARRMTQPIHLLEEGTERIGAGQFDHRIQIKTGDELQRLADSFNAMAAGARRLAGAPGAHRQTQAVPGATSGRTGRPNGRRRRARGSPHRSRGGVLRPAGIYRLLGEGDARGGDERPVGIL